ncbi:hypothetical protein EsFM111_25660 [Enterococcus sp. FM11-1]|nr:hypothetical protein EsFM111_25660 [Enterococcus sp. FM11-1]
MSNIELTISAFGFVLIVQLITAPSKQSIIGDRYTFPEGMYCLFFSVDNLFLAK